MNSKKLITILLAVTSISLLAAIGMYVKLDSSTKSISAGNAPARGCCGIVKSCCNNNK